MLFPSQSVKSIVYKFSNCYKIIFINYTPFKTALSPLLMQCIDKKNFKTTNEGYFSKTYCNSKFMFFKFSSWMQRY